MNQPAHLRALTLAALLAAGLLSSACAPLVLGGAMYGGALVATDRRTSGIQLEDQGIELKANNRLREQLGDRVHINVNSYNRTILLTGETRTPEDKAAAERIVAGIENVKGVHNELSVGFLSSISSRSSDVLLQTKVKASLIDARDLLSNAFYVVTERGEVFLMGRVTQREADRAAEVVRSVPGVKRVVRLFELISEEELARISPKPPERDNGRDSGR